MASGISSPSESGSTSSDVRPCQGLVRLPGIRSGRACRRRHNPSGCRTRKGSSRMDDDEARRRRALERRDGDRRYRWSCEDRLARRKGCSRIDVKRKRRPIKAVIRERSHVCTPRPGFVPVHRYRRGETGWSFDVPGDRHPLGIEPADIKRVSCDAHLSTPRDDRWTSADGEVRIRIIDEGQRRSLLQGGARGGYDQLPITRRWRRHIDEQVKGSDGKLRRSRSEGFAVRSDQRDLD